MCVCVYHLSVTKFTFSHACSVYFLEHNLFKGCGASSDPSQSQDIYIYKAMEHKPNTFLLSFMHITLQWG